MDRRLEKLKKQYSEIPIPKELDVVVNQAIHRSRRRRVRSKWISAASAAFLVFLVGINVSTTVANAFSSIPGIGPFIKVLTVREYIVSDGEHNADIRVPGITNLENEALELGLNEKYLAEGKELYEQFQKEMADAGNGSRGIDAGYIVKTDTDEIFAISRYVVKTTGSSHEQIRYDTIDKKNQILLTLPMLFQDDRYIDVISRNIQEQMRQRMEDDPSMIYWVAREGDIPVDEPFERIRPDQNFYLTADGQLVIVFDEYEAAPGYMGIQEFAIPTETVSELLASDKYVK